MATIVLEHCKISPSPESTVEELSLPILFFDLISHGLPESQFVLFFDFPACSKPHFLDVVVPRLKYSLSLALSHFLPLSGKVVHPLKPDSMPVIRYLLGDSVSLTVSESNADFHHLTGFHSRACEEFYPFASCLPPATHSPDSIECSILALQVTLFPGLGLSLSTVTNHIAADANTLVSFVQAWALIYRSWSPDFSPADARARLEETGSLLVYDRTTFLDINGLDSYYWDLIVKRSTTLEPPPVKVPVGVNRATFLLKKDEILKLKDIVLAKRPGLKHVSSFTVTCALAWVCSAKSAVPGGEAVADDEPEYFCFPVECRQRLNPPMPANHFGNCAAPVLTDLKHGELKGEEGFVVAAESLGELIRRSLEKGVLDGAEDWHKEFGKLAGKRQYGVAGSPRFDFYSVDYGWGRPKKFELLFIDTIGSISVCKSRDFEGGVEIGLAKPKAKLEAFAKVFNEVLKDLLLQ